MQRSLARSRIVGGITPARRPAVNLFAMSLSDGDIVHRTAIYEAGVRQMKKAPYIRALAEDVAEVRTHRQMKVLASMMAHPSYNSTARKGQSTREGTDRVERISGR